MHETYVKGKNKYKVYFTSPKLFSFWDVRNKLQPFLFPTRLVNSPIVNLSLSKSTRDILRLICTLLGYITLYCVCHVFDMHWTRTETNVNGTKIVIFCHIQKGGTRTRSQSLVCEKDKNALRILIVIKSPRKLVLSRPVRITNAA